MPLPLLGMLGGIGSMFGGGGRRRGRRGRGRGRMGRKTMQAQGYRRRRRRARLTQSELLELTQIKNILGKTAAANAMPFYLGRR